MSLLMYIPRSLNFSTTSKWVCPLRVNFCKKSYFLPLLNLIRILFWTHWTIDCWPIGGGPQRPPLRNQGRSHFWPHVAKSYFETYKSYDHMQNFRPLSQKFSEISRFEKFEFLRFCLTLTHRNCHNSLNFWDTGLIFWIYSSFYVFYKSCLAT